MPEGVKPTILNRDFTVATIAGHKIEEEADARRRGRGRRRRGCRPRARKALRPPQAATPRRPPARRPRAAKAPAGKEAAGKPARPSLRRQEVSTAAAVAASTRPLRTSTHEALRRPRQSGQRACAPSPQRRLHGASSASPSGTGSGPGRSASTASSARARSAASRVVLLKPQTYMNDSGRSVGEAQRYLKIARGRHLSSSTTSSTWRPASSRSRPAAATPATTACARSRAHIGNDYARVRIGIGHPGSKELVLALRAARLRQGRRGLARAAARRHRRRGAAAGRRRRRALPHRRGARAEGAARRAARRSAAPRRRRRETPAACAARAIRPASAREARRARWPRTSSVAARAAAEES